MGGHEKEPKPDKEKIFGAMTPGTGASLINKQLTQFISWEINTEQLLNVFGEILYSHA
jgi:hypothetical protein